MSHACRLVDHLWVPLPDGRRLAARLWLPADPAPAPAVLEYLPYRLRDGTAPRDATTHPVFAAAGYAAIRVDIAGTGDSDGAFDDEYSGQELSDGEAVIAWIAAQPWCTGKVGMIGISWGGFNGLQLAFRRPPALGAVVSVCSTVDRYADDIHYMGGCLLTDNFNWGAQMSAYLSRPPDPMIRPDWRARWLERLEGLPLLAARWQRHAARDAYWRHGSVCEDWSAIEAAVLAIGGWADAYLNAPLALAARLEAPVRALVGPWDHKYPHIARVGPAADFQGEVIRWFDRWLKGAPSGAEALPAVRAYVQEHDAPSPRLKPRAGRWVAEPAWPSPRISDRVLHLSAQGLAEAPAAGRLDIATDLAVGAGAAYFCPGMRNDNELADDQAADDALSVCLDTAPLDAPLELLGRPALEIAFAADRPVAQLVARLCDVAPDGSSQRISYRAFHLGHHAGHDRPRALEPGAVHRATIPLNTCAHRLAPGHRLRLALSTSYWPVVWPAPEPATVTLELADCRLVLPERQPGEEPAAQAPAPVQPHPRLTGEMLRPPAADSRRTVAADGTVTLETLDDFGMQVLGGDGLAVGSRVEQGFSIRPGDPLSAVHSCRWTYEFRRGDWQVAIVSESRMTCDAEHFHMHRRVRATEGAEASPVIDRETAETLPRGLL